MSPSPLPKGPRQWPPDYLPGPESGRFTSPCDSMPTHRERTVRPVRQVGGEESGDWAGPTRPRATMTRSVAVSMVVPDSITTSGALGTS